MFRRRTYIIVLENDMRDLLLTEMPLKTKQTSRYGVTWSPTLRLEQHIFQMLFSIIFHLQVLYFDANCTWFCQNVFEWKVYIHFESQYVWIIEMQAILDSLLADVERIIIKAVMQQNVASTNIDSSYLNDFFWLTLSVRRPTYLG